MDIHPSYWGCTNSFNELVGLLKDPDSDFALQIPLVRLKDDLGRLRIWAENAGAHRSGRMSLDYKLREATRVKHEVVDLLQELQTTIRDGMLFRYLAFLKSIES